MHTVLRSIRYLIGRAFVVGGALILTLALFLVLPILQAISETPPADTIVQAVATSNLPPPPPPPPEEEEKPEPEKEEEKPPELTEDTPPLDLEAITLALNPGGPGSGWGGPDVAVRLPVGGSDQEGGDADAIFQLADLDQKPRALYQPSPNLSAELRKKAPATVNIIFLVDARGRVESPVVQSSSDPAFEPAALAAIKQWKFEPGKRKGEPVKFRMRVPITFPKGR